jgi:hypothetical protein
MPKRVDMTERAVITLNGSGAGTARLGPLTAMETWYPVNASVKANTNPTNEAQCVIYVGQTATQENFRDNTFSGSSGDASGKVAGKLSKGSYVFAVWSGGDAGQQATLTVTGEKEI